MGLLTDREKSLSANNALSLNNGIVMFPSRLMDNFSSNFERKNLFSTVIQQCSAKPINVEDPFDLALQTVFTTCDSFQRVIWKRLPTNNNYSHWNKCFFLFGTNISLNLSIEMNKFFSDTAFLKLYYIKDKQKII